MNRLLPYLTFNGNCKEAMSFYHSCLGGELIFQTIGESPLTESLPEKMKDCILLASLKSDFIHLMATDMTPDSGLIRGNIISLLLTCPDDKTLMSVFSQLQTEGRNFAPVRTHEGGLFVQVTDKYGVQWLLNSNIMMHLKGGKSTG